MSVMFVLTYVYLVGWGNLNWPLLMRWFPRRDAPGVLRSLAVAAASGRLLSAVVRGLGERHPRRDLGERLGRIGETGNLAVLTKDEWNVLVDLIQAGQLRRI